MCGIVGYIGNRDAADVIVKGLHRLEYRGYDSAGVAIVNGELSIRKTKGKVSDLERLLNEKPVKATMGIGHTRWATHGEPNDVNAHPHISQNGKFALVHNGIIENYDALKVELSKKGHKFLTETDTEVLAHLIEEVQNMSNLGFEEAVQHALRQVVGTYGLAIVHVDYPDMLIVARKGSPLIVAIGDGEYFVASDASPVVEYTNKVIYLDDDEMAVITRDGYEVKTTRNIPHIKEVHELEMSIEQIEKGGYDHFMLKEIYEQPRSIADCLRGRVLPSEGTVHLGGIDSVMDQLMHADRFIIAACGTSWHSGLVGEYLFEHLAKLPVEVEYASEFRYKDILIGKGDVMIVISQSGETADTLAALREAKERGATVVGICNVVGSTIARETDAGVYIHAGPEIGVASTKAFTGQVAVLAMMALMIGRARGTIEESYYQKVLSDLHAVPAKIGEILKQAGQLKNIAQLFTYAPNFLYLGRSYNFPVALEGALKLKEISYIHAEGYPAAEMKHGPIALIDHHMPVVIIATTNHTNDKTVSNIQEVRARHGRVVAVTTSNNDEVKRLAEFIIDIPEISDCLSPLLSVIPLQLLSYYIAVNRGCNVDQPRNLAKSVTVE
ncbi:MAG TPA: glutamine--fructose-6-phosphate transaminase (isomerizing) [Balneolales bacterium]|nr:glutamine--fructose-6-phosphate transaminase (isomerizing) [Balneolales bacterium]